MGFTLENVQSLDNAFNKKVVGSLMGTTLDVDLVTLRSRGVVCVLVAIMDPKILEKHVDETSSFIGMAVGVKLKGYELFFRCDKADFVTRSYFCSLFLEEQG
jgi:hypothetical protein